MDYGQHWTRVDSTRPLTLANTGWARKNEQMLLTIQFRFRLFIILFYSNMTVDLISEPQCAKWLEEEKKDDIARHRPRENGKGEYRTVGESEW